MTITCSFTGNLGNHMFQYATTRAIAEHNGYTWGFNPKTEYDYWGGKPQMDFMDIDYGVIHDGTYSVNPKWVEHEYKEKCNFVLGKTFYPYQPEIFNVKDNTKLYINCCQDARYLEAIKGRVAQWFKINEEKEYSYKKAVENHCVELDENMCVLNIRGGEYKGVPELLLSKNYWLNAMVFMKDRNPKMKFLAVSDDEQYANQLLDFRIPVVHISIGGDYYIINNAKNLILSNSSFAIFPTWLNKYDPYVIAPFGWARHNVTTGYWVSSAIYTYPWNFLTKEGELKEKGSIK